MKEIAVSDLPPNSYVDAPVFLDDAYILLAPDIPVSEGLSKRLAEWDFRVVRTSGKVTNAPAFESAGAGAPVATLTKNVKEEETSNEVLSLYKQKISAVTSIFDRYKLKNELRINEVTDIVKQLIVLTKSYPHHALNLPDIETPGHGFLPSHAVKSAILAVALADFLKLPPHRIIEVGIAGLLHTIGMMRIPPEIYLSERPLNPKEKQMIIAHPILGFRALKDAAFPVQIAIAVLEHHERIDGSGYPRKLAGDKLSLYGKIIAVSSSYVAAVSERPFRQARDGHSGIMDLLKDMGRMYDEKVLRALVFTLSIFPIGTYVELANKARGVVIRTNPESPKLPVVKLFLNPAGEPYADLPLVQVEESGDLSILRPLTPDEVKTLKEVRLA